MDQVRQEDVFQEDHPSGRLEEEDRQEVGDYQEEEDHQEEVDHWEDPERQDNPTLVDLSARSHRTGDRTKAEEFLTQWNLFIGVNLNNTAMQNPYQ